MFNQSSPFFQSSKRVAEDFLRTTVIVDDQAYFPTERQKKQKLKSVPILKLNEPGRESRKDTNVVEAEEFAPAGLELEDEIGSHVLDAQKVINSFANKHIVCSVIRPSFDVTWISSVKELASSADILILDWEIKQDNGKKTKNLLGELLKCARQSPEQLRLLVIYTGDPKISEIAGKIKAEIQKRLSIESEQIVEQDDGFSFAVGSIRVVIFSKPGTNFLPEEYQHRKVDFENLADRVTSEFAVMTAGLVSNAVIGSLALIRNNTHKILSKFSPSLDAPYLTHRALQVDPEDAEDFLTELIAEEFRAILDEESIGKGAGMDSITEWLSSRNKTEFILPSNPQVTFTLEEIIEMLQVGLRNWSSNKVSNTQKKDKSHKLPVTAMLKSDSTATSELDENFSLITTVRSYYEKKQPKLTFGTILQETKTGSYWICLQPRCDSVRIHSERAFPMLPLLTVDANKPFRLVVAKNGTYIKLSLRDKPYDLRLINFKSNPNDRGVILAKASKDGFVFTNTKDIKYKWLGELRPEQAQRIANEFASNLSRVGLDESEWLRLWATEGG